ncbi:YhcH/YjgK/YiaL family protein [Acerihabitans sp. KWT182]|uniref:YhcH/YjgK/YiaL family protein n=1 Tax=Acerihabitans sp. KWT182 TaxID=3157919 RepID=A0AAU7QBE3_9GAMM
MIIDTVARAAVNPLYPAIVRRLLQMLRQHPLPLLEPGRYVIDGDALFFTVIEGTTRPLAGQRPELHRRYVDVHLLLEGEEIIGAAPLESRQLPDGPFNEEEDIGFYQGMGEESVIRLRPGDVMLLFPGELHRPMATLGEPGRLRKVVAKIDSALLPAE